MVLVSRQQCNNWNTELLFVTDAKNAITNDIKLIVAVSQITPELSDIFCDQFGAVFLRIR